MNHRIRDRLTSLLERWAQREVIMVLGRCLPVPEVTHLWVMNKLGGFEIVDSGICWERSTKPNESIELDEFGIALRSLPEICQGLIIVDHFGDKLEWQKLAEHLVLSKRNCSRLLRIGWLGLTIQAINRELL